MFDSFTAMETMHQVYWIAAIVASVVFIIQAIGIIVGFDSDSDFDGGDADFDAEGFSLVSFKTIVCFVLGFGWTGVLFYDSFGNSATLGVLAVLVGLVFMALIAFLLRQVMKLSQDNSFRAAKAIGKDAEVYLRIPAAKSAAGKVTVSVDGTLHELEAVTELPDSIPTGTQVRIIDVVGEDTVIVEPI